MTGVNVDPHADGTGVTGTYFSSISVEDDEANQVNYVLETVSDYLLETAYGFYSRSISLHTDRAARCLALLVLASNIRPMPVAVTARVSDQGASVMVQAASLLSPDGCLAFTPSLSQAYRRILLVSVPTDQATSTLLNSGLVPSRARRDAAYMHARLATCAGIHQKEVLEHGSKPSQVLKTLATLAGDPWPRIAADLLEKEVRDE